MTGATGGIGKATALGLAAQPGRARRDHRPRPRPHRTPPPRDPRRRRWPVVTFVADLSAQSEVRRLADEVLQRLPRIDVLVNNVGGLLEHPARHRRRSGAHLRPQPPRAVPAHQPARSTGCGRAPRRAWSRSSSNAHAHGADRLRRPPGRAVLLRARGPTTSPSSPTSCSPTSWPGGCGPPRVTANALHPGRGAHLVRGRGPRRRAAVARPIPAAVHEEPRPGRRHLDPPGVRSRSRAGDGPLLRRTAAPSGPRSAATTKAQRRGCGR